MKTYSTYIIVILVCLSFNVFGQALSNDSINQIDENGNKYGKWMFFYSDSKNIKSCGNFINNNKEGLWKFYFENGNLQSEINYKKNLPDGYAKIYYQNGRISEEGNWELTKWTGVYKYYHENGKLAYEWNYNASGKRTGEQKYYYNTGKLMIKGNWKNGEEDGTITEYFEDGSIKSEKIFNNGEFNESASVFNKKKIDKGEKVETPVKKTVLEQKPKTPKISIFSEDGYHKIYNTKQQLYMEGVFKKGKLMDGKKYYYDKNGNISKIVLYSNGQRATQ